MILDTSTEATRVRWRVLADLSGEERLRQALELTDFLFRVRADGERDLEKRLDAINRAAVNGSS